MIERTIADLPDDVLRSIVKLCPQKPGESLTITALGKSVTLTSESRARGVAELNRRKAAKKKAKP